MQNDFALRSVKLARDRDLTLWDGSSPIKNASPRPPWRALDHISARASKFEAVKMPNCFSPLFYKFAAVHDHGNDSACGYPPPVRDQQGCSMG